MDVLSTHTPGDWRPLMLMPLVRPSDDDVLNEFRLDFFPPALPQIVATMRHLLRDTLGAIGLDSDTACLLLSELLTNAIVHGAGPAVVLELRAGVLYIAVADSSSEPLAVRPGSTARTSGRGLFLVEQLADEWGVEKLGPYGKAVWARTAAVAAGVAVPGAAGGV
ncbi:ATP-binding protein [Kitasatospora sp. NBC_00315]|uniref:ATP-binding protein n=1 Tax=Kitasatospora sp. NBC_00315 TaxID=2975963 RepID=UPI00324DFCBF